MGKVGWPKGRPKKHEGLVRYLQEWHKGRVWPQWFKDKLSSARSIDWENRRVRGRASLVSEATKVLDETPDKPE